MTVILALDQGTTSSRALVFDTHGNALAQAQRELPQSYPRPGWVEHDARTIWRDTLDTARDALARAGVPPGQVAAIGITNQRETVVLWDRATGEPLAPAIVWQDRRTAEACAALKAAGHEAEVQARSGLLLDPYFSASKLAWLLDGLSGARDRAARGELAFGTVDSWLVWQLTGGAAHVTDISNASRTLLFNIHDGRWDEELLRLFRIPAALLPRVVRSSEVVGHTVPGLFGTPIPIAGIAGDQQAALFGQACHASGMAKNTYGTGCFLLLHTGSRAITSTQRLLTSCAAQTGPGIEYALEGSVFVAGAAVQWLRDALGIIRHSADVEALAASVPDSGGATFVPAFTGLGAPYWEPDARGLLAGLTRGTGAAHVARAVLEAIAFQSVELVRAMRKDAGIELTELRVDGGATANRLLMQIQADLLGVPVVCARVQETTALGAAYLAGLAVGVWTSKEDIAAHWAQGARFSPAMAADEAQRRLMQWQAVVRACLQLAHGAT